MMEGPPCQNFTGSNGFNFNNDTGGGTNPCSGDTSGSGGRGGGGSRGGRGGGGRRYGVKISCGYCDTNCIYKAIEILFIIGVMANIIVIMRIIRDRKLRDPTFVAIAALAVADLLFLSLNLTLSFESVILTITCGTPVVISTPYYLLKSIFWFGANAHVAFLAVLRYLSIAYPIRASVHLTNAKVIISSIVIWVIGVFVMGTLTGFIAAGMVLPGRSREFLVILWIFVYLLPLIVTCILHALKIFRVRSSTRQSATEATRKSIQRMSRIVILVIVMATILPIPRLVSKCLNIAGRDAYPSASFKTHFVNIANIIFLMNHTVNPFIYGFMSVRFRQSVKDMFASCRPPKAAEDSAATSDTPLSVRKQNFSMEAVQSGKAGSVDSFESLDKD